jgi:hypothetical protein
LDIFKDQRIAPFSVTVITRYPGKISIWIGQSIVFSVTFFTGQFVIVSDQGKGISAEFLPYIFNRFSQADGTSTRSHGGLGLGLSIVHSLVELQNGVVTAENARTGSGAIFTISLPAVSHHPYSKSTPEHNISHQELMIKNDNLSNQPQLSDLHRVELPHTFIISAR